MFNIGCDRRERAGATLGKRTRGLSVVDCLPVAGKTGTLSEGAMSRSDVWQMVRRRAAGAGIETAIDCHSLPATGITGHLTNGGRIEVAQRMAWHSNAKVTGLYDQRADDISVREAEKGGEAAVGVHTARYS